MKKLLLLLLPSLLIAANEPINVNSLDGKVKQTSSTVGSVAKPFDFSDVNITGVTAAAATNITASAPIVVTPSPIATGVGTISLDPTSKSNWDTAFSERAQWDGGATNLVPATGRTSLGLGTAALNNTGDFQPIDSDLTAIAGLTTTTYGQGFLPLADATAARTYIGAQAAGSYEVPLTFSQSLARAVNTVTLLNDSAAPGNSQYYGTNSGGTKGWFALPAAGSGTVTSSGPPTVDQTAVWTTGTNLKGVTTIKGGTINQVLKKNSSTDYDYAWAADATGGSPTWGTITGTLSSQTDLQTALDAKLATLGDLSPLFTTTEATQNGAFSLTNAAATTVFGRAAGTSGAPSYSASPQFTAIGNLTSNGFVKTGGGVGTLSVDTSTYLTANQNISLTGDVTGGPAATSIATTIGANKVTLGMMAQMATDSILGRATALTGNVEVLAALPWADTGDVTRAVDGKVTTLANIPLTTTIAGAAGAQGDVLYYGATGWAKLAAGTNGNQLTTHGAAANPTWDAPGSGGSGTPGGSDTHVQYNNAGAFGGVAQFIWTGFSGINYLGIAGPAGGAMWDLMAGGTAADTSYVPVNGLAFYNTATTSTPLVLSGENVYANSSSIIGWQSSGRGGTLDTGFYRNAAGVVEINNGTPSSYRDLKLRTLLLNPGAAPTGVEGALYGNSTDHKIYYHNGTSFVDLTAGGAGGTPGGSTTQMQFNDGGAFGGATGLLWDKTNNVFTIATADSAVSGAVALKLNPGGAGAASSWVDIGTAGAAQAIRLFGGTSYTNGPAFQIWPTSSAAQGMYFDAGSATGADINFRTSSSGGTNALTIKQGSGVLVIGTGADTAIARNGAGVLEINNGTAATYRDLKARTVNVTSGYQVNGTATGADYINSSVTNQTPSTSDVYLTGSNVVVPAGAFAAKGQYRCLFDVTKSAGTGAIVISVRIGTTGTVASDTAQLTFTFGAGTSVSDTGTFEVITNWRTVGSGTSAVITGFARGQHNLATTGLFNNAAVFQTGSAASGGFNSTTATNIGVSFNGSTSFAGTVTTVQASLVQ